MTDWAQWTKTEDEALIFLTSWPRLIELGARPWAKENRGAMIDAIDSLDRPTRDALLALAFHVIGRLAANGRLTSEDIAATFTRKVYGNG